MLFVRKLIKYGIVDDDSYYWWKIIVNNRNECRVRKNTMWPMIKDCT